MCKAETCDVLIVGAGPAGSACAGRLRESGLDVRIIDKKSFPRDKVCAGWVTPAVMQTLRIELEQYRKRRVLQPICGFRTGTIEGPEVETRYERVVSYGIRRCEFDDYLRQLSGAPCQLGKSVRDIERVNDTWIVNGVLRARMLVGAGGHFCPVARKLGARQNPRASVVRAQEVEFLISDRDLGKVAVEPETPELFFCNDLKGYGWCFRKGDYLNIGLGRLDTEGLSKHVERFCQMLRDRGKVNLPIPTRFRGHAYQLYERIVPKLVDDGVVLIGDSAGLAYPQSGEGIRPAVESGILAADTIKDCGETFTADALQSYSDALRKRLGRPRTTAARDRLPNRWLSAVASRLLATRWFSRQVVLDQWFLHANQPPLSG